MAAAAGIFNPQISAGQALAGGVLKPMDSATTGTNSVSSASGSSATISANDFLTLLVTEMQNQDPTATTDPNEYINQLVQVNSLEQLIGINETLTGALGTPSTATSNATGQTAGVASLLTDTNSGPGLADAPKPAQTSGANGSASATALAVHTAVYAPHIPAVAGNLGVPAANPAAARVASALDGRTGASPIAAGITGVR